jgi:hypothetical protein
MEPFRLADPEDPRRWAYYGWDHVLGFFVEVHHERRIVACYDALNGYEPARPLDGALRFLVAAGFLAEDEVAEAIVRSADELPEEMSEDVRRAAEVIGNFKMAAD